MLDALTVSTRDADPGGLDRAGRSLRRQGFAPVVLWEWDGGHVNGWARTGVGKAQECMVKTVAGQACCVGSLWYRGRFGAQGLMILLDEMARGESLDENALRGNFALFIAAGGKIWLLNDGLGFVRIHCCADQRFFSTSWLAACAYLHQVRLNWAAAIEYVLLGASHSRQTVAHGVDLLPLGHGQDLSCGRPWNRFPNGFESRAPEFGDRQEAIQEICGYLRNLSGDVAAAFPGKVNTALSGGFDSRLIVAGLLAAGLRPNLFVYGGDDSADVVVAKAVAHAMGLSLSVVDKRVINRALAAPDLELLEHNALFFDGLPNDTLVDAGADQQTRLQQNAAGMIALNGGGGEIFRNFFHLPNRSFAVRDIVRTFYRGFSGRVFRRREDLGLYQLRLAASMSEVLGLGADPDRRLSRKQVELLYPLFRCHYWMGVNNSVSVRHGHYVTPLVDPQLVRMAQRIPLCWKQAGVFESQLIAHMHPGIAALPGSHGFRFDHGPDHKERMAERLTCARPVRLRPFIGATRRYLQRTGVTPDLLQRCRQWLPGEWRMDAWLDLDELPDDGALGRALAVEVVWRQLF